ncbi:MAG: type II toxin-antitoxin system RelE/ParE family toxin [Alphaproteobacteria bacterium]|nr:type II toxin-antitoxin system RelE/ParE family toxin [Alphaproteobacteria bacterium]
MSRPVRFRPSAVKDLERLADFLIERNPAAAVSLSVRISEAVQSLGNLAERGRPGPRRDLREIILRFGRSRYIIRYQVRDDAIVIIRLWHGRERRGR